MTYAMFCEKCKLGSFTEKKIENFICAKCNQPERSKREDFYGMKVIVENGILTMENGEKFHLNQCIEDAVL